MKLTPYTPANQRPTNTRPAFGASVNPFQNASKQPAAPDFKPLQKEERFLCRFNGKDIMGGSRLNVVG